MLFGKIKKVFEFSLLKNASVYTVSNLINALIPFLLIPVLTRYLTPEDYGITAMMGVMIGFLTPFIGLSLHGSISVNFYKKDEFNFPEYVSNCLLILILTSICATFLVIFFSNQIAY